MDTKDKRLIYLLDKNSRDKESELAKQLVTSKQVVNYRIKRLLKKGVIKQFQSILNLGKFGINVFAHVYFKLSHCDDKKEKEILNYLIKNKVVYYVGIVSGNFDICVTLLSSSIQKLEKDLNLIISKYSQELGDYVVSFRSRSIRLPKNYLSSNGLKEKIEVEPLILDLKKENIKELDKKILKLLSNNSRLSFVEIGNLLGISFSTVREKVKAFERKKIILGYSILLNVEKIGMEIYRILVKTNNKSSTIEDSIFKFAFQHQNFVWVSKTFGMWDYELRVNVENHQKLRQIIKELRQLLGFSIDNIETLRILEDLKEDYSLLLENTL